MTTTLDRLDLADGIYEVAAGLGGPVVRSLVAGAFPTVPPAEWFANPKLTEVTPLTVEDSGRVYGHLADWKMAHIGLPRQTRAPRSQSGYSYFLRGALPALAADGSKVRVRVGQLTNVGGHAPMSADAGQAVAHYDDTQSAVCDVNVGEDEHGIWFAGALRSDVTPERLRSFCASSLSGDWRPINGSLEMVACCSVNVPGFPITRMLVASGETMALVAAGAAGPAQAALMRHVDASVMERLQALEAEVVTLRADGVRTAVEVPADTGPVKAGTPVVVDVTEQQIADAVEQIVEQAQTPEQMGLRLVTEPPMEAIDDDTVEADNTTDEAAADVEPEPDEDEPAEPQPPTAVQRARMMMRARQRAKVHRTTVEAEYEKLIAASAAPAPMAAAFKLEDWMTPTGVDGQVVRTGARIAVASKSDESVSVAKVLDVTRRGIKVKWLAGKSGTGTISASDVAALVRTSADADTSGGDEPAAADDGGAEGKADASADGAAQQIESLAAAFNPNQLRDTRGRFIEMGSPVNVKGDDGKERRGTVTKLTKLGPQVTYDDNGDDGPAVEIIPAGDTTDRISVAPEAKAELPGNGAEPGSEPDYSPQALGVNSTMSQEQLREKRDAQTDPKAADAIQKLMDAQHDDELAAPRGSQYVKKPNGVSEEDWTMSLQDRGYARSKGLPVPTAKQAQAYRDGKANDAAYNAARQRKKK